MHAAAWKETFDEFLATRSTATRPRRFSPDDYDPLRRRQPHADGTRWLPGFVPRLSSPRAASTMLPASRPYRASASARTAVLHRLATGRVEGSTVRYGSVHAYRAEGLATAVVSSSAATRRRCSGDRDRRPLRRRIDGLTTSPRRFGRQAHARHLPRRCHRARSEAGRGPRCSKLARVESKRGDTGTFHVVDRREPTDPPETRCAARCRRRRPRA